MSPFFALYSISRLFLLLAAQKKQERTDGGYASQRQQPAIPVPFLPQSKQPTKGNREGT